MRGRLTVLGVLGLALVTAIASADPPKTVKLFGQEYDVEFHSLAGTYQNGVTISQVTDWADRANNRRNNLDFVEGASPAQDRLFVVSPPNPSDDTDPADQFYLLTGTDANGLFTTAASNATQYFGGKVSWSVGGRPSDVTWISDEDTGVKKDHNILLSTFAGDDYLRFYDLDTLVGGSFTANEVDHDLARIVKRIGAITEAGHPHEGEDAREFGDPNAPGGGQYTHSRGGPNGTLVAMAKPLDLEGVEVGLLDPKTGKFLNVLTNLNEVTADQTTKLTIEGTESAHSLAHLGGNLFMFVYSDPDPGGNGPDDVRNDLVRVELTFPTDLNAGKNTIKTTVLGVENLLATGLDDTGAEDGIFGLAAGREIAPGKRILYMADWNGNLITLRPR